MLAEVAQIAQEIVVIDRGRVGAQASVADFTASLGGGTASRVRTPSLALLGNALDAAGLAFELLGPDLCGCTTSLPRSSAPSPPTRAP